MDKMMATSSVGLHDNLSVLEITLHFGEGVECIMDNAVGKIYPVTSHA